MGLIGPNGAGKTTTISAIFGVVGATAGSIRFRGDELRGWAPERIVRAGLAIVPEGRRIFQTLTVAENLQVGAATRRNGGSDNRERVLDLFPVLKSYLKQTAGKLSGGEQQQLAVARALLSNPRLLLLDEPSLGLAPKIIDVLFETLARLRDAGVTVLLVEQNVARTLELADRTYVLRRGIVALDGVRDELLARADFTETYLGL